MDYSPFFKGIPFHQEDPAHPAHPIQRLPVKVVQIPVHFVGSEPIRSASALKIQKVFRGFLVRKSVKKILSVKIQVDGIGEGLLRNEVVELINTDEKERLRMNESLMAMLFKLDSIRGVDSGVRDFRKAVIRKAISLQERIDAIAAAVMENRDETQELRDSSESNNSDTLEDKSKSHEMEDSESHNSEKLKNSTEKSDDPSDKLKDSEENLDNQTGQDMLDQTFESEDKVVMEVMDVEVVNGENFVEKCDTVEESLIEKGKGNGGQTDRELLEKMMEENGKMMSLMTQLNERNEMQMRTLNALTQRVEKLEKAFVCDMLRRKKKKKHCA